MSKASERKAAGEVLAAWSLMPIAAAAKHMDVTVDTAKKIKSFPWIRVRGQWKADPIDVAVYVLAGKEGKTVDQYWHDHGDETPAYAGKYLQHLRTAQVA